jgi:quinol monooxygenase YgiN
MHVRIATFDVTPMQLEAVAEHFRVGAIGAFSTRDGFLGYQGFVDRDRGRMVGISRWQSLDALEASSEPGREIIEGAVALGAVMVGEPQILELTFDVERVQDRPNLPLNTDLPSVSLLA